MAPSFRSPGIVKAGYAMVLVLLLQACAGPSLKEDPVRDPPSYAPPPATSGLLFEMADAVAREHGEDRSGFHLLDGSEEALRWRLALMDSAVSSLAVQTYLWYPDATGKMILDRAIHAADRGVQVRLIIDDLLTIGLDQALLEIDRHPNIELRLFNAWRERGLLPRAGEMIKELERLNTRMHDKVMVVDGRAMVIGGRNLGDHYFGLGEKFSFHDLDVMGFGVVAQQVEDLFDHYWNSDWVLSASNIDLDPDPDYARNAIVEMHEELLGTPLLAAFPREPTDWTADLEDLLPTLAIGPSKVVYDMTPGVGETIGQEVAASLFPAMGKAQEELLVTNAYIIPDTPGIEFVTGLVDRGVRVRILTNSLSTHDVPAVNAHYRPWRDDFIRAGAELYELRADAAIMEEVVNLPPAEGQFPGLHTKAFVADRELVFIGSMNFDPRSINLNTEDGVYIRSPELGERLALLMERNMLPENAWRVQLDDDGKLYWTNSDERVDRQPARGWTQRVADWFFQFFPKDLY